MPAKHSMTTATDAAGVCQEPAVACAPARIGFIGVGSFAYAQHLRNAATLNNCRVHALCDLNADLLDRRAAEFSPAYVTTDAARLLNDEDVEIVVIGTRQDTHASLTIRALEAGKWVLVEKPLGDTSEEVWRVVQTARHSVGRVAVGHNRRFAPVIERARELLKPLSGPCHIHYRVASPEPPQSRGFYSQRSRLHYEGCHMFDLANHILGQYPVAVLASGHDRNAGVICEYADGSRLQLMLCSCGSMQMDKEMIEFFKANASISIRDFTDLRVRGIPGAFDEVAPGPEGHFADELMRYGPDFADMVRGQVVADALRFDAFNEGFSLVPTEQVKRIGCAADVQTILRQDRRPGETPFEQMNRCLPDRGHRRLLQHFVRCYQTGQQPRSADALDGAMACETAEAAARAIATGARQLVAGPART